MMRYRYLCGLALMIGGGIGCTSATDKYCDSSHACPAGQTCNLAMRVCEVNNDSAARDASLRDKGLNGENDLVVAGDSAVDSGKKALGGACQAGETCVSGHCVDGVCCAVASCGECSACDVNGSEGHCATAADGASCGADRTCSSGTAHVWACLSGVCKDSPLACGAYACGATACNKTCSADLQCAANAYCKIKTKTCEPKVKNGSACSGANECQSGICTASEGVCCNSACSDPCETCAGKATCSLRPAGTPCGVGKTCVDYPTVSREVSHECDGKAPQCQSIDLGDCGNFTCDTATKQCWNKCESGAQSSRCISGKTCQMESFSCPPPAYTCYTWKCK